MASFEGPEAFNEEVEKRMARLAKRQVGQTVYWIEPTDRYKLKAQIVKVHSKGSPGMGMGAKPLEQDVYVLKLLENSPKGNQHRAGEQVFATDRDIA